MNLSAPASGMMPVRPTTQKSNIELDDTDQSAARAAVYSLLGSLLARPCDDELLERLSNLEESQLHGSFLPEWLSLKHAAQSSSVTGIVQEYNDLFVGLARGELVPYGSWYLTGFLMDKPLSVLRRDLAKLGYERAEHVREPEDHAGALCETMSLLISDPAIDAEQERGFFAAHVEPWLVTFFQDLAEATQADFYRPVGTFGAKFIQFEIRYLSMPV